jgi:hypothetical protein
VCTISITRRCIVDRSNLLCVVAWNHRSIRFRTQKKRKKKKTPCAWDATIAPLARAPISSAFARRRCGVERSPRTPLCRSARPGTEPVWPLAPDRPKFFWPELISKIRAKVKKKGRKLHYSEQYTPHLYLKKERDKLLRPAVRFALSSRCRAFPASYISTATRFSSFSLQ